MLYIITTPPSTMEHKSIVKTEYIWHVGQRVPHFAFIGEEIEVIQADGDELDHIIRNFSNLPFAKNVRVHRWHGDLAKLIYYNLKS